MRTGADSALVIVHTVVGVVLTVCMTVMEIVDVVAVDHGTVATSGTVSVPVALGGTMLGAGSGHDRPYARLSGHHRACVHAQNGILLSVSDSGGGSLVNTRKNAPDRELFSHYYGNSPDNLA